MKRFFICAAACMAFAACNDMKEEGTGSITDNPILSDSPTTPLQPSEQKGKLESVAMNFLDECPADDFEKISRIAEAFGEQYLSDDYDFEPFAEWFEEQIEEAYDYDRDIKISGKDVKIDSSTEILILLANHKGHFIFGDSSMTLDPSYDGLKATFYMDGKTYEAVIEQNGKVTEALFTMNESHTSQQSGYYDENGSWVDCGYGTEVKNENYFMIKVGVPESLQISLSEDGTPLAQITANFALSTTAAGLNPTTDSFSTDITISIEDYQFVIERLMYDGAAGTAAISQSLKKNGQVLLSLSISGEVRFDIVTERRESEYYTSEYVVMKALLGKNITAAVDILGQLQIIGTCSNALEASDSINEFWDALYRDNVADEDAARRHLENFNSKFDFGVFYDRGNNRQADLEFTFINDPNLVGWDVNGDGVVNNLDYYNNYNIIPIIVFNDGSKYSIEEYFTERAFEDLIEKFYEFCEDYDDIFGFSMTKEDVSVPSYHER